jgi:hypothetical protein
VFRPVPVKDLTLISRYLYRKELAPVAVPGRGSKTQTHVASTTALMELPYRLLLASKLAFKREVRADFADSADELVGATNSFYTASRIGWRFYGRWDTSAEYRTLVLSRNGGIEWRSGLLYEVGCQLADLLRLGVGYNLSRIADAEVVDSSAKGHGFFVRLTGHY